METAKENRSDTIPVFFPSIAPHLRESAVLKMLHEEEPTGRPVEWPPRPSQEENKQATMDPSQQQQMVSQQQQVQQQQQQQHRQQNENAPNMTTTYPSGFKLRERAPVEQAPARVVTSQPAFKMTQPIRKSGDSKWPPKGNMEPTQQEVREFIKPRKSNKDYSEFFAQNALPHNYAAYRPAQAPQHPVCSRRA
nr:putative uncharacterized protein DDB_G0294196 isoform X5 [Penaeus vannamei]